MNTNDQGNPSITSPPSHSRVPRLTRSGARRQGDEYQDVQALNLLVEWLEQRDRYQRVQLEADGSGSLDDLLALRSDGVLEVWQVKFSTGSYTPEDAWT